MGKRDARRKGGKDSKAEKQAAKAAKQKSKSERSATKRAAKEAGEQDIESVIKSLAARDAERTTVTVTRCEAPSPRANFSLTALPSGELLLFGGEFFDGETNECFNDLFRFSPEKQEWRLIESPGTPPPRCSHQACVYRDALYVLGGEFATSAQFYHYADFWRLDVHTNVWDAVEARGQAPSARSGHRVVVWRKYLVCFGGFYKAMREQRWFNDVHLFCFASGLWSRLADVGRTAMGTAPAPRSACAMACHAADDTVLVYGGYAEIRAHNMAKSEGKAFTDGWLLHLRGFADVDSGGKRPFWERLSRRGQAPSARSGAAMCVHKNRALLFGGVHDTSGRGLAMTSVFYNELFAFDLERRRWYRLLLRQPSASGSSGGRRRRHADEATTATAVGPLDEGDESDDDIDLPPDEGDADDGEESEADDAGPAPGGWDAEQLHNNLFGYIDASGNMVYEVCEPEEEVEVEAAAAASEPDAPKVARAVDASASTDASEEPSPAVPGAAGDGRESSAPPEPPPASSPRDAPPLPPDERPPSSSSASLDPASEACSTTAAGPPTGPAASSPAPLPRIAAGIAMRSNSLFVYGGILETGEREVTLDDCWSLDVTKRVKWQCHLPGTMRMQVWHGDEDDGDEDDGDEDDDDEEEEEEDDDDDDDDDDEDDDDDGDEEDDGDDDEDSRAAETSPRKPARRPEDEDETKAADVEVEGDGDKAVKSPKRRGVREEIEHLRQQLNTHDSNRTPQLGETLRQFFDRTKMHWTTLAVSAATSSAEEDSRKQPTHSEKELKRIGFGLASARFEELLPVLERLNELEAEQRSNEAGPPASHARRGRR